MLRSMRILSYGSPHSYTTQSTQSTDSTSHSATTQSTRSTSHNSTTQSTHSTSHGPTTQSTYSTSDSSTTQSTHSTSHRSRTWSRHSPSQVSPSQVFPPVVSTTTVRTDDGTSQTTTGIASQTSSTSPTGSESLSNSPVIIAVAISASVTYLALVVLVIFFLGRNKKTQADYRNSSVFGAGGGRRNPPNVPERGVSTYSGVTYFAVPLTDDHTNTHPHATDTVNSGVEMTGMGVVTRDSRYSAAGYSDSTPPGSASGARSLSAQQHMSYANGQLYGHNVYGLYPVSNRVLIVPSVAGSRSNAMDPASATGQYNAAGTSGGDSNGYRAAAGSAGPGPGSGGAAVSLNQPPSPLSPTARFEGSDSPYAGYTTDEPSIHAATGYNPSTAPVSAAVLLPPRNSSLFAVKARFQGVNNSGSAYRNQPYTRRETTPPGPPPYADRPE